MEHLAFQSHSASKISALTLTLTLIQDKICSDLSRLIWAGGRLADVRTQ